MRRWLIALFTKHLVCQELCYTLHALFFLSPQNNPILHYAVLFTSRSSERLNNLLKVTQQIRGQAISLTLEPVTPSRPSGRTSEKGEGEMKTLGLSGGPCCIRSLNLWKYTSNLELCWELLGAPSQNYLNYLGSSQRKGERRKRQRWCVWQWQSRLRQRPGQLADIFVLDGRFGVSKETKCRTGGKWCSWEELLWALPTVLNSEGMESYVLSLNWPN